MIAAIKEAVRAELATKDGAQYRTDARGSIYVDRFVAIQDEKLPAIIIFATEEQVEELDNTQDRHRLKIAIEIQSKDSTACDVISQQVYNRFRNNWNLGDSVEWFKFQRAALTYDEARHMHGAAWTMEYEAKYIVSSVPDLDLTNPADFILAEIESDLDPDTTVGSHVLLPQAT